MRRSYRCIWVLLGCSDSVYLVQLFFDLIEQLLKEEEEERNGRIGEEEVRSVR